MCECVCICVCVCTSSMHHSKTINRTNCPVVPGLHTCVLYKSNTNLGSYKCPPGRLIEYTVTTIDTGTDSLKAH